MQSLSYPDCHWIDCEADEELRNPTPGMRRPMPIAPPRSSLMPLVSSHMPTVDEASCQSRYSGELKSKPGYVATHGVASTLLLDTHRVTTGHLSLVHSRGRGLGGARDGGGTL
jgi:hypothetical protein